MNLVRGPQQTNQMALPPLTNTIIKGAGQAHLEGIAYCYKYDKRDLPIEVIDQINGGVTRRKYETLWTDDRRVPLKWEPLNIRVDELGEAHPLYPPG